MKKFVLAGAGLVAVLAVAVGLTAPGFADKADKPPKQAIDQIRAMHDQPSANPDDISGPVDPARMKLAVIKRDPNTGEVVRDADGLPQVLTNPDGSTAYLSANDVPPDQLAGEAKHQETLRKAAAGDKAAQKDLTDEAAKTADAVAKKTKAK